MPDIQSVNVISNTLPMLYLHRIGQIDCLRRDMKESYCPNLFVLNWQSDILRGMRFRIQRFIEWIDRRHTSIPDMLNLITDLGAGEDEVIALGMEVKNTLLILDDGLARRIAGSLGLRLTGTVGILCAAKREGLINNARECLDALLCVGFRLRPSLYQEICKLSGDSSNE